MSHCTVRMGCVVIALLLCTASAVFGQQIVSVSTCQKVSEPGTIPVNLTDQFTSQTPEIHAVVVMEKVRPGTVMKGAWVSVDAIETPKYEIDFAEMKVKDADVRVHFSITKPDNGWPVGNYKLNLYVNNKFVTDVPFTIVPESGRRHEDVRVGKIQEPQRGMAGRRRAEQSSPSLLGQWQCRTELGTVSLIFQTEKRLVFDGEPANYSLVEGAIRIEDEFGQVDYPYTMSGGTLTITFPEGYRLQFQKIGDGPGQYGTGRPGQQAGTGGSGREYLLQGKLCSWSGARSGESSYSTTRWAWFDGQGKFRYGSESSYSGKEGLAYIPDASDENTGTYRVVGDTIYLTFSDGETAEAAVHFRQDDGRITEIMVGETLYGASLCE